jgi:hypothetical protein
MEYNYTSMANNAGKIATAKEKVDVVSTNIENTQE